MKQVWYSRKWVTILLHLAAWIILFSLPFLLRPSMDNKQHGASGDEQPFLYHYFTNAVLWIGFFYLNALVIIPKLLYRKKYWQIAIIYVATVVALVLYSSLFFKFFIHHTEFKYRSSFLFTIFIFLFFSGCSTAYQLIRDKIKADQILKEKENENLKTELSLLRSQVSPHFMFNVLNNMVALARKQSDQLEPSLIKLSSLMRYMLYEADEETVPLEKEIEYLRSYIDLQQQRFGRNVQVNVAFDVSNDNHYIEPMLLIPFVENAFKHGTGMIEDARIDIDLKTEKNKLLFSVRNKFNNISNNVKDKTSGIGLANVKRRLNLLYGGKHSLLINKNDDCFRVSLEICLR
ncbi:MAG: histidine kinase [Bacteroidetes bacterium]|nr:MAG: histidine kinase [Bacteroidota bacterium]